MDPDAPPSEVVIRPARESDLAGVERLVSSVAGEVYGHLFPGDPPRPEGAWALGLVALRGGRIVGVVVTEGDWIEDLWVAADCRGRGIGSGLLAAGERQIAGRGHPLAHLRVIAENLAARRFYAREGWSEAERYPHEKWGFAMIDLSKPLTPPTSEADP